jgi:hypothetical protein
MTLGPLPKGLCGNRDPHEPHVVYGSTVARVFWCHADQSKRLPWAWGR